MTETCSCCGCEMPYGSVEWLHMVFCFDCWENFKKAIELARKNVIVGEINFPQTTKVVRTRKAKNVLNKDLPDLDKKGYMNERKNPTKEETE